MGLHRIKIENQECLDAAAREFLDQTAHSRIIALYGKMGAGKTTFTTALCRVLGVREDAVGSPTFAIVNEYRMADGEPLYHFAFYRISSIREALDIGFYDYVDSGALCIMEWPENIEDLLPEETLRVRIEVEPDGARTLEWTDNQ